MCVRRVIMRAILIGAVFFLGVCLGAIARADCANVELAGEKFALEYTCAKTAGPGWIGAGGTMTHLGGSSLVWESAHTGSYYYRLQFTGTGYNSANLQIYEWSGSSWNLLSSYVCSKTGGIQNCVAFAVTGGTITTTYLISPVGDFNDDDCDCTPPPPPWPPEEFTPGLGRIVLSGHGKVAVLDWREEETVFRNESGSATITYGVSYGVWSCDILGDVFQLTGVLDPSQCSAQSAYLTFGYRLMGCGAEPDLEVPEGTTSKPSGWPDTFFLSLPNGYGPRGFFWYESRKCFYSYPPNPEGAVIRVGHEPSQNNIWYIWYETHAEPVHFGLLGNGSGLLPLQLNWTRFGILYQETHSGPAVGLPSQRTMRHPATGQYIDLRLESGTEGRWWYRSEPRGWTLDWRINDGYRPGWYLAQWDRTE